MCANTLLSTPPDKAHKTFFFPTVFLISKIIFSSLDLSVQFFSHLQTKKNLEELKFMKNLIHYLLKVFLKVKKIPFG